MKHLAVTDQVSWWSSTAKPDAAACLSRGLCELCDLELAVSACPDCQLCVACREPRFLSDLLASDFLTPEE